MKQYSAKDIFNVALIGHSSSGKTTLADAILFSCDKIDRIGKNLDATTVMDFDAEEKKRKVSLSSAVYQFERDDKKINMIDTPGLFDFAGGVSEGLTAADSAIVVLSGKSGLAVGAELTYDLARAADVPCAFFIGKFDSARAKFDIVLNQLKEKYGAAICPVVIPITKGDEVIAFVDLIHSRAYSYDGIKAVEIEMPQSDEIEALRSEMIEAAASADEELMEKYFDGQQLSEQEILRGISKGMLSGGLCPVFSGINQTGAAVGLLLDIYLKIAPSAADKKIYVKDGEGKRTFDCDESGPAAAVIFKTIADPFVGKLSYLKVVSGKISADMKLINSRTGGEVKPGKLLWLKGGKQEDASTVLAGDIVSVAKLSGSITKDTLYATGNTLEVCCVDFPAPCLSMAVTPKNKGDDEKISAGLTRLVEEDPTLKYYTNHETHQLIISGLGEQHLDVVASKLKNKFGVEVVLSPARVAYRETIKKSVKVQGRHKKQSGGHGQFGDVWIEFEPADCEDMIFEEKVFGGAVPKNFFPAVEKGLRESIKKGVLAGYPVVGLKATLVDGSYHPVDSSEMSFKMAAAVAYKEGMEKANPVLLEPIGMLKVIVPDEMMGDVIGDINKRRGRMLGMSPVGGRMQEVLAEVPMSEMSDFSTAMRSISQGRATFIFDFERYEEAPDVVAQRVIEAAQKEE